MDEGGEILLWDARTRRVVTRWKGDLNGINGVAFSPDGTRLATDTNGGSRLWALKTHRELVTLPGAGVLFYDLHFSKDGSALLAGNAQGGSYVWQVPSFAELDVPDGGPGLIRKGRDSPSAAPNQ